MRSHVGVEVLLFGERLTTRGMRANEWFLTSLSQKYNSNIIEIHRDRKGKSKSLSTIRLCISLNQTIQTYMVAQVDLQAACPRVPLIATNVLADEGLHA